MKDTPSEDGCRLLESVDPDLDPVWGLLAGSAPITETDDHERKTVLPVSCKESSVHAECVPVDARCECEEMNEHSNQKEIALSIIPFGAWHRVGRFPFTLSSSSEASLVCTAKFAYHDKLRAQLFDEDGKQVGDTSFVSMTDEDWVCLNYVPGGGGGDAPSSRLLSCVKDCGHGWSVCFDVKELTEDSSISYVSRFVRVAKSCMELPQQREQDLSQTSAIPGSSIGEDCLDCTDVDACSEVRIPAPKMFLGTGRLSSMHDVLLRLALSDDADLPARLLQPGFWNSISQGATMQGEVRQAQIDVDREDLVRASSAFQQSGYSRLQGLAWEEAGISLQSVALTMESLNHHGLPPVFIFMYDEPWLLFEKLFNVVAGILGCDAVVLDTSLFAWALRPAGDHGVVGSNFGRPHRDYTYNACHKPGGEPSALSVWMPIVPVTMDSGCMYVVPSEHDPLFDKPEDPRHMCPDQQMPWAHIQPLPCSEGDVLLWHGNLIHWGSACNKNVLQPRKSIAGCFRIPCESNKTRTGTLSHADVRAGLSIQARLKVIIGSLLGYEHWHPGFAGLSGLTEPLK